MNDTPTVAQTIARDLARHGVDAVFAQSLPSAIALAIDADPGMKMYAYRTENGGAAMADGFARVTNRVGVVMGQNGPAATLLVPGLAEALKSSIPIVALVQDVNRPQADRNAFQELDHIALFQGCTKWVRRVTEASRVSDYIDMAFAETTSGRPGPAVLMLPADLLNEKATVTSGRKASLGVIPLDRTMADPARIRQAADLIAAAKNPLIVAGGGVHLSGDVIEFLKGVAVGLRPVDVLHQGNNRDRRFQRLGQSGHQERCRWTVLAHDNTDAICHSGKSIGHRRATILGAVGIHLHAWVGVDRECDRRG